METLTKEEGSVGLYQLPPGMVLCINAEGAMRIMNRSRTTLWRYVQLGRLRAFNISGNILIPLADIASFLGLTETQIYNTAITYRLPLYQLHPERG